jgi:hypothetical protein
LVALLALTEQRTLYLLLTLKSFEIRASRERKFGRRWLSGVPTYCCAAFVGEYGKPLRHSKMGEMGSFQGHREAAEIAA